jgi:hypothetical protein
MRICIEILSDGYRRASFDSSACGAVLIVRPDGSESWSNVQPDSPLYAALNAALFAHPGD